MRIKYNVSFYFYILTKRYFYLFYKSFLKSKSIKYIFLTFLLFVIISSCKDNKVVTPVEDFAPARFNWRSEVIPVYGGFAGMWAKDANNIYLINNYTSSLYILSNGNISSHSLGSTFWIDDIKGISLNEVYIFGGEQGGNMTIIKWNGGGFEYFRTDIPSNLNWYILGCVVSQNEIWICSANGIAKFDGNKFTYFDYPDILLNPLFFFLSLDNKLQYIGTKTIDTSLYLQSLYEFRDTGFVRIFNDTLSVNSDVIFLRELSGLKYGVSFHRRNYYEDICIKNFNGLSFQDYFCFNQKIIHIGPTSQNNPMGMNLQNFIIMVNTALGVFDSTRYGIFNWDGESLSKELKLAGSTFPPFSYYLLYTIDINNYLVLEPTSYNMQGVTLYLGTRK